MASHTDYFTAAATIAAALIGQKQVAVSPAEAAQIFQEVLAALFASQTPGKTVVYT